MTKHVILILSLLLPFYMLFATSIPVTSNADSGSGSLRDVVANANAGDTITFALSSPDTIHLQSGILINKDLVIWGPGRNLLEISGDYLTGRLVSVDTSDVEISQLSFSEANGNAIVYSLNSFLSLDQVRVHHNGGYGVANTGGSHAILTNCEIDHNGDGVYNNQGTVEIYYSTLHHHAGNGIRAFNKYPNRYTIKIHHSSIFKNTNTGVLCGQINDGSGDHNLEIYNSTISENGNEGVHISFCNGYTGFSTPAFDVNVDIQHCSIVKNGTSGITKFFPWVTGYAIGPFGNMNWSIKNSIVAQNGYGDVLDDSGIGGGFSGSHCLINHIPFGGGFSNSIKGRNVNPRLLPLTDNGGNVPTYALAPCSPAINAGDTSALATDQRDSIRYGQPDIGAYEYNPNGFDGPYNLSGTVSTSSGAPLKNTKVYVIGYQPGDTSITALDSAFSDTTGFYEVNFWGKEAIYVKVAPDSAAYPMEMPTYYDTALVFQNAMADSLCEDSMQISFSSLSGGNPGGPGFIGGKLVEGANKGPGDPLGGVTLILVDVQTGQGIDWLVTASDGSFAFDQLPYGSYALWADKPLIDNSVAPFFVVDMDTLRREELEIALHSTYLELLISNPQPPFSLQGTLSTSQGATLDNTWGYALTYQAADSSVNVLDSAFSDANGAYKLTIPNFDSFYLKVSPDSAAFPQEMPTYVDGHLVFQDATAMIIRKDTVQVDFASLAGGNPGGTAYIGGNLMNHAGNPASGITLVLVDQSTGQGVDWLVTKADGAFEFAQLPYGSYELWADKPLIDNGVAPVLVMDADTMSREMLEVILHPTYLELLPPSVGIEESNFKGKFSFFPNPMKTEGSFLLENVEGEFELKIFSFEGKIMDQVLIQPNLPYTIYQENWVPGLYFYFLSEKGEMKSRGKLVIIE